MLASSLSMSLIPKKSLERSSGEIFKHWKDEPFVPSGWSSFIITRQSAVRVSQRGKQNITRYVKDSAVFTIVSQSEKIGQRWLHQCFKKDTDYSFTISSPFLFQRLKERKKTEVLSGHLFGSALWWVEKSTTAQNKLEENLHILQILLNI